MVRRGLGHGIAADHHDVGLGRAFAVGTVMKWEPLRGFISLERKDASSVAPGRAFLGREVKRRGK
jgi:hypothetical protein